MAKRKNLQELQARIASLLQQANSEGGVTASWLGVYLGGQRMLFSLQQSGEIYALGKVQPLPYVKPWFRGVTALRGQVYGVVDLSFFLSMYGGTGAGTPESAAERSKQRLVGINEALGVNAVFQVDALEGLRGCDDFVRSEFPPEDSPSYFGSVFYDSLQQTWQEIHLQFLVQDAEFLDIASEQSVLTLS